MTQQNELFALVLAGGRSERMGRDKAAVKVSGETLLERTFALADAHAASTFVSIRDAEDERGPRGKFASLVDVDEGQGPLAGILAALEHAPDADWLVLACDLPRLDASTLEGLVAAARDNSSSAAIAIRSERDGLPEPLCAVWRGGMREHIRESFSAGRFCARKCLMLAHPVLIDPVTPGALDNMNTERDLADILTARQRDSKA